MADWPQVQEHNRVTVCPASPECIGSELIAASQSGASGQVWPTANRAIFVPFRMLQPFIVVKLLVANGGTASGNLDLGVYDDQGNRLVSKGSTAQAGTSVVQALDTTDTLIGPGNYYLGCAMDGTVGTCEAYTPTLPIAQSMGVLSASTAFALPDPVTFVAAQDAFIPVIGLTARVLV